jgi:predicted RNase H-like HicB family nuclease
MAFTFTIEAEQEDDDRWTAEIVEIPGARAYGSTEDEAVANLQALALLVSAAILPVDTLAD